MLVDCTWGMSEGRRTRMSIVEKGGRGFGGDDWD